MCGDVRGRSRQGRQRQTEQEKSTGISGLGDRASGTGDRQYQPCSDPRFPNPASATPETLVARPSLQVEKRATPTLRAKQPLPPSRVAQPKRAAADGAGGQAHPAARTRGRPTPLVLLADLPLLGGRELRGLFGHSRLRSLGYAQNDLAELLTPGKSLERITPLRQRIHLVDDWL